MSAEVHDVDPTSGRVIRQPYRETRDFAAAAKRFLRALGRRAACDVDALPLLLDVEHELHRAIDAAVAGCRDEGYSWAAIGDRLGITKQAAQQRFGVETTGVLDTDLALTG